ncbi:MAG TPA: hypothetical protein VMD30_05435 [Tepidisphaeraceae bacterium]|nr:hypothetical protein [Tepidisphaeraceae bacterium]
MTMDPINSLSGALAQGTLVQRHQSAAKTQQLRLTQQLEKNVAARDDEMEHQVENSEELTPLHEDQGKQDQKQRKGHHQQPQSDDEEKPGLDLTA